jgi:hypothetical protein
MIKINYSRKRDNFCLYSINMRERDQWGDQDVDGRIILRWIFRTWEGVGSG